MKRIGLKDLKRGLLAGMIGQALPVALAMAPMTAGAGGHSLSSGARRTDRRYERVTSGNVYQLDTQPTEAAGEAFAAFGDDTAALSSPAQTQESPRPDRLERYDALRHALADNGLFKRTPTDVESVISGLGGHREKSTESHDTVIGHGFAGKPQFSGVCSTLFSLCTSDAGNLCITTNAPCTGARPPGVNSIVLDGAPAATATTITYTVMFDEKPTAASVSADDFQVTTVSGTATGSVTGVVLIPGASPLPRVSDNRFTVTVSSIAGNGTIRLDLKANTNIIDVNPQFGLGAAGPFGNGNAGFTAAFSSGTVHTVTLNNAPTGAVTISGTVTEDQTLTANTSALADADGLGAFSYQWKRGGVAIVGATASTYVLGDADVGSTITVTVSYTDGGGNAESVTSAATAAVANVNDAPTGSVTIAGVATEDQTLTASNTLADADGLGALGYQWNRGGVPIVGATASTYVLGDADVGAAITVTASYTDGHGTSEAVTSAATAAVANINDAPTGGVTIAGVATEDQTLTANNTLADADGLGVLAHQWRRNGVDIVGATASTYVLGDADVGATITVRISYTDGNGTAESATSAATAAVANLNDAPTGSVSIAGTATEDQTLTASNTLADVDGLGAISYQWNRGGVPIVGATASTYVLGDADVGATITVTASYTDGQGTAEAVTSAATAAVANINDAPTGGVTIAGVATEDQTLTANNTLADADGLGVLAHQWRRNGVDIVGATASTYALGDADVGATITVAITYTDGNGTAEGPFVSAATAAVANLNDAPTGGISITGTVEEDQTLTAASTLADGDGLGVLSYQWRRDGIDVVGATAQTYLLGDADVAAVMSVVVNYTDQQGTAEGPFVGGPTVPVVNVNEAPTGSVTISGTATEDQTLTASNTLADADGLGAISYQWNRGGVPIVGATASTYVLGDADVGATITVTASYTDGQGTAEAVTSAATAAVANINDAPTGGVTIAGVATEDQTLTANNTLADVDGLGALAHQWRRNGVDIVGATAGTYVLGDADVGATITVRISYTDGHGTAESATSAATAAVANLNDAPTGGIGIAGVATENQTLTASSTLADADGLGTLNYQWRRDGIDVVGATNSTYLLDDADVGAVMSVAVTYTDLNGTAEGPFVGGPTAAVANANDVPTGSVMISGTATEDQTLTASNTLADADGLGAISYQWNRGGVPIVGATASTYVLGDADVGATITVTASYTDGQGASESATSAATAAVANVNDVPTGGATIAGVATEDQTLTASNTLADVDGLGAISYQWNRGGAPIVGATASTYVLGDADVGATLTVTASYTDGNGTAESATSAATAVVANINDAPTGGISITGTVTEDQTLTASSTLADADGLGTLSYQWRRDGVDVVGATAQTYLLGDADVGAVMSVTVTYTDAHGTAEGPFVGGPTAAVANANDAPTGAVTISGTVIENQTLTASNTLADADGLGAISYQWQRDGVNIPGATGSSYVLVATDIGAQMTVVASYVDGHGTPESVASTATAPVEMDNRIPEGGVTIAGEPIENVTLSAVSTLSDGDGLGPLQYQWQRDGINVVGATTSTYVLNDADVGARMSVSVRFTDLGGTDEGPFTAGPTAIVENVNDLPVGVVTIDGTVTEEETLTADATLSDEDGLGEFSYQWLRDGETIAGATASIYTISDLDVGRTLSVVVSYVDARGTAEAVSSADVGPVHPEGTLFPNQKRVFFVPASNQNLQRSILRFINPNDQAVEVELRGIDDDGIEAPSGRVIFSLGARQVKEILSKDLVSGSPENGLTGRFGAGEGSWQIKVGSTLPVTVMNLIRADALIGNLSDTVPKPEPGRYEVYFASPVSSHQRQSIIRVINRSSQSGPVTVSGIDDSGNPAPDGDMSFVLGPQQTLEFDSLDMARGNSGKGIIGALGEGDGNWRLTVRSPLSLEVMSLLRSRDGLISSVGATVPRQEVFDPAVIDTGSDIDKIILVVDVNGEADAETHRDHLIRFVNPSDQSGEVVLSAIDANGQPNPSSVAFEMGRFQSREYSVQDLEAGNTEKGLIGSFGSGNSTGRWQVAVSSALPLEAMSLVSRSDGYMANLSERAPQRQLDGVIDVPLLNPDDALYQRSFLRLVNRGDSAGSVRITAVDDAGVAAPGGAVVVELAADAMTELSTRDLERGSENQTGAFGDGAGRWRLQIESDIAVDVQALMETRDGLITNTSAPVN